MVLVGQNGGVRFFGIFEFELLVCPAFDWFEHDRGGFDASNYVTERKGVTASDETQIPMSIVYNKKLAKLDGSDPILLYDFCGSLFQGIKVIPFRSWVYLCNCSYSWEWGNGETMRMESY